MSVDLDTRARKAGASIRDAVSNAELTLATPPRSRVGQPFQLAWAVAGAAAAVIVLVAINTVVQPNIVADDTATFTTTTVANTTTTTPEPAETVPLVVPAADPTTTTTAPPTTTTTVDSEPPEIKIFSPTDGQVFEEKTITFSGTTEPGAQVFAGPYAATVSADGQWQIRLVLSKGANRTVFTAVDAAGNQATATVTAVYEPPAPKDDEPEIAAFTANATWIECSSEPAFDEYYGTGHPGSWVVVQSEFGGGETLVNDDGKWYLKVIFDSPRNQVIDVKVKDQYGRFQFFDFVAVEPK